MRKGIVGHEEKKFTKKTKATAKDFIALIMTPEDTLVSGHCHLGGVDIYAEDFVDEMGYEKIIHKPRTKKWATGFKPRNLLIAKDSEVIYVILVKEYPPEYTGRKFELCYHCDTTEHVKSGVCWTAWKAVKLFDIQAIWIIISPDGSYEVIKNV